MVRPKKHANRDSELVIEFSWPYTFHIVCQWYMYKMCVFLSEITTVLFSHCLGPHMAEGSSDSLVKDAIVSVLYDTSGPQVNVKGISRDLVRENVIDGNLEQRILSQQTDSDSQHILAQHLHNYGTLESVKLLCRVAEKLDKACGFSSLPAHSHEVCFGHTIGFGPTQLVFIGIIELLVT